MKRFLSVLLAAMMVLSACAALAEEPVKEIYLFQYKVDTIEQMQNLADMFAAQYDKAKIHINVETVGGSGDFKGTLATKVAANDIPDLIAMNASLIPSYLEYLEPLDNEPWKDVVLEGMLDPATIDGVVYGQPLCVEAYAFIYNVELFEKAGITEAPKTYSELVACVEKLEAAGIRAFTLGFGENWIVPTHFFNGSFLAKIGGDIGYTLGVSDSFANHSKEVEEMVNLLQLCVKHGGEEATLSTDYNTNLSEFANGEAAILVSSGTWTQPTLDSLNPDLKVGVFGFLTNDEEGTDVVPVGNEGFWVINKNSEYVDILKDFLTWMATDEGAVTSLINDFKFIPAVTGVDYDLSTLGSIYAGLQPYLTEGKIEGWLWSNLPSGFNDLLFAPLQQIGVGMMTVEEFIAEADSVIAGAR